MKKKKKIKEMNGFKWFFMSMYKKLLYSMDVQYSNKGGLWIYTDNYAFRLDFKNMKIEVRKGE